MTAFASGVMAYHAYPREPAPADPPVLWAEGTTRLLDYGIPGKDAPPLLIVPSLINRAGILDLTERRSFCRWFANQGFRPLLVDWDAPGEAERNFGLNDYINGRLASALDVAANAAGRPVHLVGYCMGGNLALALAARTPEKIRSLALLATPWDFHADGGAKIRMLEAMLPGMERMLDAFGQLPVDAIQSFFTSLDPYLTATKFARFAAHSAKTEAADLFVALEDWLNDGVPLTANVARECLKNWYVENAPQRGGWLLAGTPVIPEEIAIPTLLAIPERDHIVPPASALALLDALPEAEALTVPAGHIGMIAGSRAESGLYKPLGRWLNHMDSNPDQAVS